MESIRIMSIDELGAFLIENGITHPITPQFDSTDGITPVIPDGGFSFFDELKGLPHETLIELGMKLWDHGHYLYPAEWYDFIPDGYEIIEVFGDVEHFRRGHTDNDRRFGALSFGFRTKDWVPEENKN